MMKDTLSVAISFYLSSGKIFICLRYSVAFQHLQFLAFSGDQTMRSSAVSSWQESGLKHLSCNLYFVSAYLDDFDVSHPGGEDGQREEQEGENTFPDLDFSRREDGQNGV